MHIDLQSDRARLLELPKDKLIELLLLHIRNLWSEDGLYFLGIENRYGTEIAIDIDREVWAVMGKLEARRLREKLNLTGDDLGALFEALKHSTWWLYLDSKEVEENNSRIMIRNNDCRVQITRVKKGFGEFDCKSVRTGFLKNFVKEFNPDIKVNCNYCPLDNHPEDAWCEWEFTLNE